MKKIILIIIDGLGDMAISQLGNKTPLEAAKTSNLDWLAEKGICGQIQPFQFPWQDFPESDVAHLALFGYDPRKYYLGRGVYEAAGIGFRLQKGDIALRANFATVDKNLKIIDRRAGRIDKTEPLINAIGNKKINGIKFILKKSISHRAVLILRGKNLSEEITDNDPHENGKRVKEIKAKTRKSESAFLKNSQRTAAALNEFLELSHCILNKHPLNKKRKEKNLLPANYLLLRGAGRFEKVPGFSQKYGLKPCCIAGGNLYKGVAKILGMDLIKVKGANALPTTNLKGKFLAVRKSLKKFDFAFCHIKAADNLAEDGNFKAKKEFIEKIDRSLNPIMQMKDVLLVVTADHSTCSELKSHCSLPVPVLVSGKGIKPDNVRFFSEKACKKGNLGTIKGLNLMSKILARFTESNGLL